ncbi:SDR family oxidoreductase [Microbacterium sp. LWH7-1.2]
MADRLAGKVALISGAARGMGAAFARAMVAEGAYVVVADVLDAACRELASELGARARFAALDVRESAQWDAAVAVAVAEFGGLSVLVNNAGIIRSAATADTTDADWDDVLAINLTGAFRGIRASLPALTRSAPSSIVNISSTAGMKGMARIPAYTASKFGLRGLTKSLAVELGTTGVRVNSVHPGNIRTDMLTRTGPFPLVPAGRAGTAEEVARVVVFLASDESSFVTGAEYAVDGGETAGVAGDQRDERPRHPEE